MAYEARYCSRCIHGWHHKEEGMCAVWAAHMLHNYAECNKSDSILNMLIPRTKDDLGNDQCAMFIEDTNRPDPNQLDMFKDVA